MDSWKGTVTLRRMAERRKGQWMEVTGENLLSESALQERIGDPPLVHSLVNGACKQCYWEDEGLSLRLLVTPVGGRSWCKAGAAQWLWGTPPPTGWGRILHRSLSLPSSLYSVWKWGEGGTHNPGNRRTLLALPTFTALPSMCPGPSCFS